MFTIAHFTDAHLPLRHWPALRELGLKRLSGFASWRLKRSRIHRTEVITALTADLIAQKPDHVAFTGDIVNLALPAEFAHARAFLELLGNPRDVTMVPGNHDAYTAAGLGECLKVLSPWMEPDSGPLPTGPAFPFVRYRRNVAFIGLSTAVPTPIFNASGRLGAEQIRRLAEILHQTRERGFARVVMLHHPPHASLAKPRKWLADAPDLCAVLAEEGAELVLYGHNHLDQHLILDGRHGPIHCIGMPSASALPYPGHPPAAYALYGLRRQERAWKISLTVRGYDPHGRRMVTKQDFTLAP
jgi:3',5'-cyclic AMP phosphodiesterase CpdA